MGAAQPLEEQRQERIFLVSGPLNTDCVYVALKVFLCPSKLPVEICLLERLFIFAPVKNSEQSKILFITASAEQP